MMNLGLEAAGGILGTEMGLMLSTQFNPISANVSSVPAMILYLLGGMLLFSLDLHHWMLAGFQRSYALAPVGGAHLSEALFNNVVRHSSEIFFIGLQMAAPVMAVSFIISIVFAVLGRAVPQMNVFSESFSVRTLAGLSVFGLTCNLMAQHIVNYLRRLPEDMLRVAQMLGA
jgi:flagellar biosynthetic protein FliR